MGYPSDILSTRAVIRPGKYVVIPPEGLVNNVIPGIENCRVSIVASPKEGIEVFFYVLEGTGTVRAGGEEHPVGAGDYLYTPAGTGMEFCCTGEEPMRAILYKQRYIPAEGVGEPQICFGNEADLEVFHLDDMENVEMKNFLPTDLAYDMNFHILSFAPGASHSFVETHIQEHGMYILEGEGVYLLDEDWRLIKKGDFVWFGPYCPQAG